MTRYMVNKLLYEVDQDDEALARFRDDPTSFIGDWQSSRGQTGPPYPRGGTLTDEERRAVVALDFGSLYAMGVNPFLLWQFARSVCVPDMMTIDELIASFRVATEPHGFPDYST